MLKARALRPILERHFRTTRILGVAAELNDPLVIAAGEGNDPDIVRHVPLQAFARLGRRFEGDHLVEPLSEVPAENADMRSQIHCAFPIPNELKGSQALGLLVMLDVHTELREMLITIRNVHVPNTLHFVLRKLPDVELFDLLTASSSTIPAPTWPNAVYCIPGRSTA
jgi:hypothetical protein